MIQATNDEEATAYHEAGHAVRRAVCAEVREIARAHLNEVRVRLADRARLVNSSRRNGVDGDGRGKSDVNWRDAAALGMGKIGRSLHTLPAQEHTVRPWWRMDKAIALRESPTFAPASAF